jgi:hypothetical protein
MAIAKSSGSFRSQRPPRLGRRSLPLVVDRSGQGEIAYSLHLEDHFGIDIARLMQANAAAAEAGKRPARR